MLKVNSFVSLKSLLFHPFCLLLIFLSFFEVGNIFQMFADPLLSICIKMWGQKKHVGHPKHVGGGGVLVAKSCLTLANLWTVAHQVPLSMGFPRQAYWSELPFSFQRIFLTQGSNLDLLLGRWILSQWILSQAEVSGKPMGMSFVASLSKMTGLFFCLLIYNVSIFRCFLG